MTVQEKHVISSSTDPDLAAATITAAFTSDPICRWAFQDARRYYAYFQPFVKAFGGAAFERGTAHTIGEHAGVALWLPPGAAPDDEAMGAIAAEAITDERHLAELGGFLEQQAALHPHEPHWYLPLIGVDPTQQGRGYGSALLQHATEICDREKLPAYLEATTIENKRLYARHGFEEVGVIQYGSSPPMWPMWRKPR